MEKIFNIYEGQSCSMVIICDGKGRRFLYPGTEGDVSVHDGADFSRVLMEAGAANTLVSYTVTPHDAGAGSFCYKMLIDARTHKLYYYRKHRISKNAAPGFLPEDLAKIARR